MTDPLTDPREFFAECDDVGAFAPHGKVVRAPAATGPLSGLTVAVKDLFDWAGVPTGAGNPAWLESHPAPEKDAAVVTTLSKAGAALVGKTVTDELAYSIHGDNYHYGTPKNPGAPGRVPGGSSSGSASAVAAGLVSAALGTDTGGSVRVPSSYCGLFGMRTTHGKVDKSGLVALAPSFDTVGWFARDAEVLAALTRVLIPGRSAEFSWKRIWTLSEEEAQADEETQGCLSTVLRNLGLPRKNLDASVEAFGGLEGLRRVYVTVQGWEAWRTHGDWITRRTPSFGPAVARRFLAASRVTSAQAQDGYRIVERFRRTLCELLGDDGLLLLPSATGPAPEIGADEAQVDEIRTRTMRLSCVASLAGLPQVSVPFVGRDGLPRGAGLVGPSGADLALALLTRVRGES